MSFTSSGAHLLFKGGATSPQVICLPLGMVINYNKSGLVRGLISRHPETFTPENLTSLFKGLESNYDSALNKFKRGEITAEAFYEGVKTLFLTITGNHFPLSQHDFLDIFNAPLTRNDSNIEALRRLIETKRVAQIVFISYSNPENIGKILSGCFNTANFSIEAASDQIMRVRIGEAMCPLYVTHCLGAALRPTNPHIPQVNEEEHNRLIDYAKTTIPAGLMFTYCGSEEALAQITASSLSGAGVPDPSSGLG